MKKAGDLPAEKFSFIDFWSRLVTFLTSGILLSILIGYGGIFYWPVELVLFIFLGWATGLHLYLFQFFQNFSFFQPTFFRVLIAAIFCFWFTLLAIHAPFPAFSGRDEGSYANAAVYLAKQGSFFTQPELLRYFQDEGSAHKALNYPGFVVKGGQLFTQFSPAYSTSLAIFFVFCGTVFSFIWANGLLILGGTVAFYITLKFFLPKWSAVLAVILLLFNFTAIWFPRFTLSENLAFFINLNVLLFAFLALSTGRKKYIIALILLAILAPLVRPEGFWILLCGLLFAFFAFRSKLFEGSKAFFVKIGLSLAVGIGAISYSVFLQWPVYLQLIKDFIKWPINKSNILRMGEAGGDFGWEDLISILTNILPDFEKISYFFLMEIKYGILVFALILVFAIVHFVFKKRSDFYDDQMRTIFWPILIMALPYLAVLFSPQISQDHPWFLRRFFSLILPFGILMAAIFIYKAVNEEFKKRNYSAYLLVSTLLILYSLPASAYFLTVKIDEGREEALYRTAEFFEKQKNPIVFLQRESSGDGWKMFSLPLNSLYGLEAVYVYKPEQISPLKKIIAERFAKGEKSFVVLPNGAYSFEHSLKKNFDLILEKQIDYENLALKIGQKKRETEFPLLEKTKNSVKIYSLNLKYN